MDAKVEAKVGVKVSAKVGVKVSAKMGVNWDATKVDAIVDAKKCNVPNFTLGHNGQMTFSIFMKVVKGMLKVK